MKFQLIQSSPESLSVDLVFVTAFEKSGEDAPSTLLNRNDGGIALDRLLDGSLSRAIKEQEFTGKEGSVLVLNTLAKIPAKNVVVIGLGAEKNFSSHSTRCVGGKVAQLANKLKSKSAGGFLENQNIVAVAAAERLQTFVEGVLLADYQFNRFKRKPDNSPLKMVTIAATKTTAAFKEALQEGENFATAANLARDLTNRPPNDLTPEALAKAAQEIAKENKNISCRVWGLKEIQSQKMGGLLAVTQGSKEPPVFIHLSYKPAGAKSKVALVGKGITFDSGGLNLKSRDQEFMKMDMAGAATVVGVFQALASLKIKVTVEGFIASCENMPSGTAYRPGDIIKTRAGKTVEIINTDAEGRLVLADALDVAAESKPDWMIDMATLTGGAAYALGELVTPILGNNKKLVEKLLAAGKKAGEPSWELPIIPDYKKGYLKGPADLKNSGSGSKASTISGALFLEEFVGKHKWVHMDIASTAWADEPTSLHSQVGATGNPVKTLLYFLRDL